MEEHQIIPERPLCKLSCVDGFNIKYLIDKYDTESNEDGIIVNAYYHGDPIKNGKINLLYRIFQTRLLKIDNIYLDIEDIFKNGQDFSKIINISQEEFDSFDNILMEEDDMYIEITKKKCVNIETKKTYYFKILTKYKKNEEKPSCKIDFVFSRFYNFNMN